MNIILPFLISTIAGLSTTFGSFIIFLKIKEKNINKFITLCLSFSLAIMIALSLTDLIPNSLKVLVSWGGFLGLILSVLSIFVGIVSMLVLTKKIDKVKLSNNNLYKLGILNMIALMLHNFPEGIATFLSSYQDISLGIKLSVAIMLHNIPEGISIAVPIYYSTRNKKEAIKKTFISGISEPLGAILAFLLFKNFITNEFISLILLLVGGIMITIAIENIYPEACKYKEKKCVLLGILLGIILIIINHLL